MKEVFSTLRYGLFRFDITGKRLVLTVLASSTLIAAIDGLALLFLARGMTESTITAGDANNGTVVSLSIALSLFVFRSFLSGALAFFAAKGFAKQETRIGQENLEKVESKSWEFRKLLNRSDYFIAGDSGPNLLVSGVVTASIYAVSEAMLVLAIVGILAYTQPLTALIATIYFLLVAIAQHSILAPISKQNGKEIIEKTSGLADQLNSVYDFSKLLSIMPSRSFNLKTEQIRRNLAFSRAKLIFISSIPRFFMEVVLAVGILVVAIGTYYSSGAQLVTQALVLFAAAAFRLLPSINRIQSLILQVISSIPTVNLSRALVEDLGEIKKQTNFPASKDIETENVESETEIILELSNVSFRYPNSSVDALSNVTFRFRSGLRYAVVGPSGGGKTTFIDLCLGLLRPTAGERLAYIPESLIAYVPQDTPIASESLMINISLDWSGEDVDKDAYGFAIASSKLVEVASQEKNSEGLQGAKLALSGGQKQRIGLARALFRGPKLLVLDEATSSLDSATEADVMQSVNEMSRSPTRIVVAHRLSTVRDSDVVLYFEAGELLGFGTFEEVARKIPNFQVQVEKSLFSIDPV